jgi:integrase/recombinase XerD
MRESYYIREFKVGRETRYRVHKLVPGGGKEDDYRDVICRVVKCTKNDKLIFLPYLDDNSLETDQYVYLNDKLENSPENTRRANANALRLYNCFRSIFGIKGDDLTASQAKDFVSFLSGHSFRPSGMEKLTVREADSVNNILSYVRTYLNNMGKPNKALNATHSVTVYSEMDGASVSEQREAYDISAKKDSHKDDYVPDHILPDEFDRLCTLAYSKAGFTEEQKADEKEPDVEMCVDKLGWRQAVVLMSLMYIYGLRIGECLGLTEEDVTFAVLKGKRTPVLIIRKRKNAPRYACAKNFDTIVSMVQYGKDQEKELVPISEDFYNLLYRFIEAEHRFFKSNFKFGLKRLEADVCDGDGSGLDTNYFIFGNHNTGKRLDDQSWNRRLRPLFEEAELKVDKGSRENNLNHRFRHGCAMLLLYYLPEDQRLSLLEVRDYLRHKTIKTTEKYTKPTLEMVVRSREKFQHGLFQMCTFLDPQKETCTVYELSRI